MYDGQGFWLCHKRLSQGRFPWWPSAAKGGARRPAAHQLAVLLSAGEPIAARPVGPLEKAWRWTRRHPAAAALFAATAVAGLALALVVAVLSLAYSGQLRKANDRAEQSRATAQAALALANRYLYFLRVNQAGTAWRDNALDRTAALLDECPPEYRGWEWHFVDQQRHSNLLDLRASHPRSSV
jgi:hypothetical protein